MNRPPMVKLNVSIRKETYDVMELLLKQGVPFSSKSEIVNHALHEFVFKKLIEVHSKNIEDEKMKKAVSDMIEKKVTTTYNDI